MSQKDLYVIELAGYDILPTPEGVSCINHIHQSKESFYMLVKPLEDLVKNLGGQVIDHAWLAGCILVDRLSDENVAELKKSEYVKSIEHPREMVKE